MIRVLVSACLLGERVRYDGRDATSDSAVLARWEREGRLVRFCPEVAGGLSVPRPAAEIAGEDGRAVLEGGARVVIASGQDVSAHFLEGARLALAAAQAGGARLAVLKDGSPSCGSVSIHDGTFSSTRKRAAGVTTALLRQAGIAVFSEQQLDEAEDYLAATERAGRQAPSVQEGGKDMERIAGDLRAVVADAHPRLAALPEGEAYVRPGPSRWSKCEILGHLIDSAVNNHQRLVRVQLGEGLVLPGYEQDAWIAVQAYNRRPWSELVGLWLGLNAHVAHVIGNLPASLAERTCTVGDGSPVTLRFIAEDYVRHLQHHLDQILPPGRA